MRFITLAFIAILMLTNTALAQRPTANVIPSVPAPRDPLPRFTIAPRGRLEPLGLPLPQIGLRAPSEPSEPVRRHRQDVFFSWPMMVFYDAQPAVATVQHPQPAPAEAAPATGRLVLEVEPPNAEVFADGFYVGVPADFGRARGGAALEAGVHRIDISALGYEPATVDLRLIAGQSMTYRASLKALPPPPKMPPSVFYLIPGCYMGNIPPKDARLPASCDQTRVTVWRP